MMTEFCSMLATLAVVFAPMAIACRREIAEAWRDLTRPLP